MPDPPSGASAAAAASSTAPRGVALELAANATLDSHGSASNATELDALKVELKKWVEHSLQLDSELTKAELRINETNEALRRGRGSRSRRGGVNDDVGDGISPSSSEDSRSLLYHQRTPSDCSQSSVRRPGVLSDLESEASLPAGRTTGLGVPMLDHGSSALAKQRAGPDMIRLLLVEDDPFQADAILALCEQCHYQTQVASSASEALELVRKQPDINLVLSDVMMEGTSGYDLLCRIRAIRSHVSVIMLSAYESIDLVQQCILSGADAYLLK